MCRFPATGMVFDFFETSLQLCNIDQHVQSKQNCENVDAFIKTCRKFLCNVDSA